MATTATLNGGPTGGLHATPTLIHTDNPPQEETCRGESNSSFESGHEEQLQGEGEGTKPGNNNNAWLQLGDASSNNPSNNNGNRGNHAYFMDFSEASSKKRRKQSRPVRIPADPSEKGTGENAPQPVPSSTAAEEGEVESSGKGHRTHHHVPLNLCSRAEQSCSEDEDETVAQEKPQSSFIPSSSPFSEIDKTELLAGQGTKDSPHRISASATGSPSLPPSFSPGLFGAPSPFSSLFSANLSLFSQQHQQHLNQGQNNPAGTPTSSSSAGSNSGLNAGQVSALQNLPPHRIFNPEAYCDLCNKEFCNKYFLKTHKANKHGVYTEMSPNLAMGQVIAANSGSNTSFLTGAAILSSAGMVNPTIGLGVGANNNSQQQHQSQSQQQSSMQQQACETGGLVSGINSASSLAKGTGGLSSEIPFSLASFSLEKATGNSNGSQQRESFCELCQKEFCNKYFLKRHKAKIHGIPIDSHSSTGSGRSSSSSNHGGGGKGGGGQRSNGGEKGLSLRDIGLETLGLEIVAKHLEDARGGKEEGELSADDEPRQGSGKSPDNEGEESNENSSFRMSSLDFKPTPTGENSCQFCLREFSSKQLLLNHVVKKHRLLLPSTFPPFMFPFPSLFDETGGDLEGTSLPMLDNNGNATGGGDGDFECNLCSRAFQTVYLLRMHKSYFHPDSSSTGGEEQETRETDKYEERAASYLSKGTPRPVNPNDQGSDDDNEDLQDADINSEHDSNGSGKVSPSIDDNNSNPGTASRRERSQTEEGKKALGLAEIEGRGETTSDSDDLRRLQTMIMELNRVSSAAAVAWSPPLDSGIGAHLSLPPPLVMGGQGQSGASTTICQICNKEFYSTYFLQQHVQHFHSGTNANNGGESFGATKSESPLNSSISGGGRCVSPGTEQQIRIKTESYLSSDIMGSKKSSSGINISPETLKERLLHPDALCPEGTSLSSGMGSTFLTPGPKGNNNNNNSLNKDGPKRPSPSLSRSYCTICHKELCNKYFMRTHMLKMHGISIESSTGLGGVTCDICNKELCSKYFLKVHKQNTHGIVEDGPSPPNPSTPGPLPNMGQSSGPSTTNLSLLSNSSLTGLNLSTNSSATSPSSGGNYGTSDPDNSSIPLLPKEAGDLQSRYFCHYSEVCPFCGRRFRSPKWLKSHLQQDHGEEGRERWKNIERNLRRGQKSSSSSRLSSGDSGSYPLVSGTSIKGSLNNNNSSKGAGRDGNKCAFCSFSTGDVEIMKSHLIKEHSSQLASRQALSDVAAMSSGLQEAQTGMLLDPLTMLFQKMEGGSGKLYRCAYCPFTTSILVYLYAHERTHTGLGGAVANQLGTGGGEGPAFQCPMCFHAFDQPEAFQQHLIGHQMSGVLAPFFTPSASNQSRLGFQGSPNGRNTESPDPRTLLSLPLFNGNAGDNLYWALKNAPNVAQINGNRVHQGDEFQETQEDEEGEVNEPAADLTTAARKKRTKDEAEEDMCSDPRPKKREKVLRFRCSYCQSRFSSRQLALAHIQEIHGGGKRQDGRRASKNFRCRKCKFTSATYQMLVVHNKLQHSALRPTSHAPTTTSTGTGPCEEQEGYGVAQEEGPFLMQSFLLTSSEEENSNQFVPSLVYLPVREKVSQSIRVSFSLTPTPPEKVQEQQPPTQD